MRNVFDKWAPFEVWRTKTLSQLAEKSVIFFPLCTNLLTNKMLICRVYDLSPQSKSDGHSYSLSKWMNRCVFIACWDCVFTEDGTVLTGASLLWTSALRWWWSPRKANALLDQRVNWRWKNSDWFWMKWRTNTKCKWDNELINLCLFSDNLHHFKLIATVREKKKRRSNSSSIDATSYFVT